MRRKNTRGWYAARALFRLRAVGKPKWTDEHFDEDSTLIEDRIVLFRARNADDAIRQSEAEAERYAKSTQFKNIYGQKVHLKFLGATDIFHTVIEESPRSGSEVYSTTAIEPRSIRDAQIVTKWWGKEERRPWQARNKFVDGEILREALEVMKKQANRKPAASRPKKK